MPRVSVVVPIYNVEPYLQRCLESLAAQTFADLEIVMVNDGSTDRSREIAAAFAERDPRFRLVDQPNRGLSAARNTGIDAASGEFLAFVDSDDVVAPAAYELLVGALDQSGSDLATGNVHRLTSSGTKPVGFLARAFAETQMATHIRKHRPLLHDRMAWNKLFRRSFWDREGRRFPEGRIFEDTPVTLPLHFAARSVDVLADVVYYWRVREGADLSITQRRTEPRALRDRLTAIQEVSEYLQTHGLKREKRWYDAAVVADDLKHYVNVLDEADEEYRQLFLDSVNAFLDGVSPRVFRRLRATERLKWHLVRRRMMPELLEVLRFQREELAEKSPVRVRGHWYLDHPFRTDRRLKIPSSLFRVDRELPFSAGLDVLEWRDGRLRIEGRAFVDGIGAPARRSQRIMLAALPPGRWRPLRLFVGGVRARAAPVHRPDLVRASGTELADVSWAGFAATLDARRLRSGGRWRDRRLDLYIILVTGRVWRARSRFGVDTARPPRASEAVLPDGTVVATAPAPTGQVALHVHTEWAIVREQRRDGDALELAGELRVADREGLALQARPRGARKGPRWPVMLAEPQPRTRFTARVPLADLRGEDATWELFLVGAEGHRRVTLAAAAPAGAWLHDGREVALERAMDGGATLIARAPRATIADARWSDDGALELTGEIRAPGPHELLLAGRFALERHVFALTVGEAGSFAARLSPAAVETVAGTLPLRADVWELLLRRAGGEETTPITLSPRLYDQLPLRRVIDHKPFRLGMTPEGDAVLLVERDLDDDERGRRQQRRLRATAYAGRRSAPLRDAVVFTSFGGRQYSDSPRAIHEELVRRGTPLEQLWVVRDGRCRVPPTAEVLRMNSREHYEAVAQARYIVTNDHFPTWFERRADQVCLQTWHGTPVKRVGFDATAESPGDRRFRRHWEAQAANWQYVLSQSPFATAVLSRAYRVQGEILETGWPRNDVLATPEAATRRAEVRARLGLPEGAPVVLYAPTFRDDARDMNGRYRLVTPFDAERLRGVLGDGAVVLFRRHRYVVDPAPATRDGFVRDVSRYPDATELLVAADVLVTDYSSLMFDFASTGRPMLFFVHDLEAYHHEVRGLCFDLEGRAPGPLLRTMDELAEALGDLDAVAASWRDRYRAFAAEFCALDDGHATARAVDRLFG